MNLQEYLTKHTKRHVIFDFDGVIATFDWNYLEPLAQYRKRVWHMVRSIDSELADEFDSSKSSYELTDRIIKVHGIAAKRRIYDFYQEKELSLVPKAILNESMIEFVLSNQGKYLMYIWSNNTVKPILSLLHQAGISGCFTSVIGRDCFDLSKPNPDGFYKIFDQDSHARSEFIMVGDSEFSDGEAARNAGIDFFLIEPEQF